MEDEKEYELVMVRRPFGGVDSRGTHLGKEILVKKYFKVEEDDILVFKRHIAHGACGVVPHKLANAVVSNEYNVLN